MKIPFIRVREDIDIDTEYNEESHEISLKGILKRERELIKLNGNLLGELELPCDSCSEEYKKDLNESVTLWFSDGEYNSSKETDDNKDVIEFFDGFIDFDEVIRSEVESIKLDYHKCKQCELKEIEIEEKDV